MYSLLNKYDLRWTLKVLVSTIFLSSSGRAFHFFSPFTLKALSANVDLLVHGTDSFLYSFADLRPFMFDLCSLIRSLRDFGASPCTHLWTNVRSLCSMQALMGNQCRALWHWVELSYLVFPITILGAISCTLCILPRTQSGSFISMLFA